MTTTTHTTPEASKTTTIRITDEYGTVWGRGEGPTTDAALEAATNDYNTQWHRLNPEHTAVTPSELEVSCNDAEYDNHYAFVVVTRHNAEGPKERLYHSIESAREWEDEPTQAEMDEASQAGFEAWARSKDG
jgi:hypothetical protein